MFTKKETSLKKNARAGVCHLDLILSVFGKVSAAIWEGVL